MVYDDPYKTHPCLPTTYYPPCPSAPCPNPFCPDPRCRSYFIGPYGHPAHRPVSYAAYNEAAAKLRRLSAEARALDEAERAAEQARIESEAKQKAADIARGKAEREKDAERGVKARERESERKEKREERLEVREELLDRCDDEDWCGCGRGHCRRDRCYGDLVVLEGRKARYLERRYNSRGRRGSTVLVTRQRAPGWMKLFLD